MSRRNPLLASATALLVAACATAPSGPGVLVLPGSSKSFEQFRADDHECRHYAHVRLDGADDLLPRTAQQRYDFSYQQCMYAKGHKVPVQGRFENSRGTAGAAYPPPPPPPPRPN